MSSLTFTYGLPASLTGPCLVTNCVEDLSSGDVSCAYTVQKCTAGSIAFDNPVDMADQQEKCSYSFKDTTQELTGTCTMKPLSGKLEGSGDTWSLVDAVTTLMLAPTTATQTFTASITSVTFLGIDDTTSIGHFVTSGAAEAATNTAVVEASTTSKSGSATTGTAKTSKTTAPATATTDTHQSSKTLGSSSTNTGDASSSQTSSAAAAATSDAKNGQNRLKSPKIGVFAIVGGLLLTTYLV